MRSTVNAAEGSDFVFPSSTARSCKSADCSQFQVVAVVSCMFVVVSTLCLIFSTLPKFQQKDENGIVRKCWRLFKLRLGASIACLVCRSVCRSVGRLQNKIGKELLALVKANAATKLSLSVFYTTSN